MSGNSNLSILLNIIILLSKFNAGTDNLYHKTSVALQGSNAHFLKSKHKNSFFSVCHSILYQILSLWYTSEANYTLRLWISIINISRQAI